ncbi:hypothetical protein HAX54_017392, partial [Datura stramonium]|nr:hypothetical protein [Datura stramonium]
FDSILKPFTQGSTTFFPRKDTSVEDNLSHITSDVTDESVSALPYSLPSNDVHSSPQSETNVEISTSLRL